VRDLRLVDCAATLPERNLLFSHACYKGCGPGLAVDRLFLGLVLVIVLAAGGSVAVDRPGLASWARSRLLSRNSCQSVFTRT
jgi:hypothetical protein